MLGWERSVRRAVRSVLTPLVARLIARILLPVRPASAKPRTSPSSDGRLSDAGSIAVAGARGAGPDRRREGAGGGGGMGEVDAADPVGLGRTPGEPALAHRDRVGARDGQ